MKIKLWGGVGNQLFQYAYLHNYLKINDELKLEFDTSLVKDSENIIGVLKHCQRSILSSSIMEERFKFSRTIMVLARILGRLQLLNFGNLVPIGSKFELHEREEFLFNKLRLPRVFQSVTIRGFFQNWHYVEIAWPRISNEILEFLSEIKLEKHIEELITEKYLVMHIRGGDYLESKMLNTFGQLQMDYYLKAIEFARTLEFEDLNVIVLTNDIVYARNKVPVSIRDSAIFLGPADCKPWEALKIMSTADVVITANSTFSWWGGFICHKFGGLTITPSPWFACLPSSSNVGLSYPGFKQVKSGF